MASSLVAKWPSRGTCGAVAWALYGRLGLGLGLGLGLERAHLRRGGLGLVRPVALLPRPRAVDDAAVACVPECARVCQRCGKGGRLRRWLAQKETVPEQGHLKGVSRAAWLQGAWLPGA